MLLLAQNELRSELHSATSRLTIDQPSFRLLPILSGLRTLSHQSRKQRLAPFPSPLLYQPWVRHLAAPPPPPPPLRAWACPRTNTQIPHPPPFLRRHCKIWRMKKRNGREKEEGRPSSSPRSDLWAFYLTCRARTPSGALSSPQNALKSTHVLVVDLQSIELVLECQPKSQPLEIHLSCTFTLLCPETRFRVALLWSCYSYKVSYLLPLPGKGRKDGCHRLSLVAAECAI